MVETRVETKAETQAKEFQAQYGVNLLDLTKAAESKQGCPVLNELKKIPGEAAHGQALAIVAALNEDHRKVDPNITPLEAKTETVGPPRWPLSQFVEPYLYNKQSLGLKTGSGDELVRWPLSQFVEPYLYHEQSLGRETSSGKELMSEQWNLRTKPHQLKASYCTDTNGSWNLD
jgi:hypothetical protein